MERIIRSQFLKIYVARINWPFDAKFRPVLIMDRLGSNYFGVYKITSVSKHKKMKSAPGVSKNYLAIVQWQQAGLDEPSWIDTTYLEKLPQEIIFKHPPVGCLSAYDQKRLFNFLVKNKQLHL